MSKSTPLQAGLNFRPIEGTPYLVSDCGKVIGPSGKVLRLDRNRQGYYIACLSLGARGKIKRPVHRLVLAAFSPHPNQNAFHVDHIDGNQLNNHVSNLRWVTNDENQAHKVAMGRQSKGSGHGMSKLTDADVIAIRKEYRSDRPRRSNAKELAARFKVDRTCIWQIVSGKTWRHIPLGLPGKEQGK